MEKEQIIKALEWCIQSGTCEYCDYNTNSLDVCPIRSDALALIRELETNNKDLAAERNRYFDMVCRAVDNAANYEGYTDATIKAYFGFTDEEYDAVTKYIQDEFYKAPDVTDEPCEPVLEHHWQWGFDGLGWSCSSCYEYPVPGQADPHKPMLDTCPNCGAIMDNADKTAEECLFGEGATNLVKNGTIASKVSRSTSVS